MSRFEAKKYLQFRPFYPAKIFSQIVDCFRSNATTPLRVLDLGAGTGFSAQSFLEIFVNSKVTLVEPDSKMLDEARTLLQERRTSTHEHEFVQASAENFKPKQGEKFDLILIGSAWHWMNADQVIKNCLQNLKPNGLIHIFEYQFPKSSQHPDLNEWVRRNFNLNWKPQHQTPRGKLKEKVEPLWVHPEFELLGQNKFDYEARLNLDQFLGMIMSQSRFIDFENLMLKRGENLFEYRQKIMQELNFWFEGESVLVFTYRMGSFTFRLKNCTK